MSRGKNNNKRQRLRAGAQKEKQMQAPPNTSKPRILCPRGVHLSRCVQVVDLGTQHFKEGDDGSRKLYLGFETVDACATFKEENGPEPFMLQIEFAWYMTSAKAQQTKLRQFIRQWFGKDFTSEKAAQEFDFSKLVNRLAMITVAHKPKTDGEMKSVIADIYLPGASDVAATAALEKAAAAAAHAAHNALLCYEITNGQDGIYKKLPPFLQKKIDESDEARGVVKPKAAEQPAAAPAPPMATGVNPNPVQPADDSDQVPF